MSSTHDILLSVAIPTRNRQDYLKVLIVDLLTSADQTFEIVIQDNSDDDSLRAWVTGLDDQRVRYYYQQGWISVIDNCDRVITACRGDYVCMLGDDDGIMLDEALKVLAVAKTDQIDAVMSSVLHYVWPDLSHNTIRDYGGKIYLQPIKGMTKTNDFKKTARGVVKRGGAMGLQDLPCVYHGFISQSALAALHQLTGSYFPGPSPDMANAVGLCAVMKSLRRTTTPLVITGHSVRSTAGAGTQRKHHGPIGSQAHLPADTSATWFPEVPFFWSGPTIYTQSLLSALRRTHNTAHGVAGMACLYASCFVYHRDYNTATFTAMKHAQPSKPALYAQMSYYCLEIAAKRARNLQLKISNRFGHRRNGFISAQTIAEAIKVARSLKKKA